MDLFQKCREYTRVQQAKEAGLYPFFHSLQSGQGTEVIMEGRRTIMLGSNNYLGLTSDLRVKEAAIHAVRGLRSIAHGFATLELAGGFGMPLDCEESFLRLLRAYVTGLLKG